MTCHNDEHPPTEFQDGRIVEVCEKMLCNITGKSEWKRNPNEPFLLLPPPEPCFTE